MHKCTLFEQGISKTLQKHTQSSFFLGLKYFQIFCVAISQNLCEKNNKISTLKMKISKKITQVKRGVAGLG